MPFIQVRPLNIKQQLKLICQHGRVMKRIKRTLYKLIISTFMFSASVSLASDWTYVDTSASGREFYIDFDTIKIVNGLTYYWELIDHPEVTGKSQYLSSVTYKRVNCSASIRTQELIDFYYSDQMGNGLPIKGIMAPASDWNVLTDNSVGEFVAQKICEYQK